MILGDGDFIALRHLPDDLGGSPSTSRPVDLREAVRLFSRDHVLDVLARARLQQARCRPPPRDQPGVALPEAERRASGRGRRSDRRVERPRSTPRVLPQRFLSGRRASPTPPGPAHAAPIRRGGCLGRKGRASHGHDAAPGGRVVGLTWMAGRGAVRGTTSTQGGNPCTACGSRGRPLLALASVSQAQETSTSSGKKEMPLAQDSLYHLATKTLEGQPADLKTYAGKVALVVNVASQCGYTPQYAGLEKLYGDLKGKGFVVLGFPSNDFGGQEPGTAAEIRQFCSLNYDVTFPLFEKAVTQARSRPVARLREPPEAVRRAAELELRQVSGGEGRQGPEVLQERRQAGRRRSAEGHRGRPAIAAVGPPGRSARGSGASGLRH